MISFGRIHNPTTEPFLREYRRKKNIFAIRINGPFEIVNDSGETVQYCIDGYLIYRKSLGTFGLLSKKVFEEVYERVE